MAITWTPSNPCPACGKGSGQKAVKCTQCLTMGCEDGNCAHGGTRATCSVCRGTNSKVRV
jgi:hypothetical protein